MKKTIAAFLAFVALATVAFASKPELPRDLTGQKLQGFAPDGKKTASLTVNSTTKDMTGDVRWNAYTPTACKFRLMSSATKAGTQLTLPVNAYTERAVNPSTPFVNFSGCTNGELTRQ